MNQSYPRHINFESVPNFRDRIRQPEFGKRLVDSLELIADRNNHPLVFHCSVGKDRTGVLAAMLLAAAGVIDEDIIHA
jgi:protein-tyrosine phosphatase